MSAGCRAQLIRVAADQLDLSTATRLLAAAPLNASSAGSAAAVSRLLRSCAETGAGPLGVVVLADALGTTAAPRDVWFADAILAVARYRQRGDGEHDAPAPSAAHVARVSGRGAARGAPQHLHCVQAAAAKGASASDGTLWEPPMEDVVDDAVALVDVMANRRLAMTGDTYAALVTLCTACDNPSAALTFYRSFLKQPLSGHLPVFAAMVRCAAQQVPARIESFTQRAAADEWATVAFRTLADMDAYGIAPSSAVCQDLLHVGLATEDAAGLRDVVKAVRKASSLHCK